MRKIPTLYERNNVDRKHVILDAVTPGCEWVIAGEGLPTRKWDGTCTMLDADGRWWARREVKPDKPAPTNWMLVSADAVTGKRIGWEPIEQSGFAKWHAEAVDLQANEQDPADATYLREGTYELIGPKVNKNPDGALRHALIRHGMHPLDTDHIGEGDGSPLHIIEWCRAEGWEGIVWHHPDGRMAKLKVRDISASTPEQGSGE